jgi:hypothetical protein
MTIYDDMKTVGAELLAEFKQGTITLVQITPGDGPADDPGEPDEDSYTLDAVVKGAPFKYLRDGFVTATDLLVTAAVIDGVTPTKNDFIEIDGVRCKIIEDVSAPSAGTRAVWKFLVRR